MATIDAVPEQYKSYFKALTKSIDAMIDIVADNTTEAPNESLSIGQIKANRIAEFHIMMQNSVTEIEKMLVTGAIDMEGQVNALKLKPLVTEPTVAEVANP